MDGCPNCDFCEVLSDGTLFCAVHEIQVHHDGRCEQYDHGVLIAVKKGEWFGGKSKDRQ